jgi:hypothetical protein
MVNVWAVACTYRPDIEAMNRTIEMMGLGKRIIVVANGENPPTQEEIPDAVVLTDREPVYNMPRWWNKGLDYVSDQNLGKEYEVFIFGSDTMASNHTVIRLAEVLRERNLAATCPDRYGVLPPGHVWYEDRLETIRDMRFRMTGYAFVLRGELELRADPQFRSWYIDDDLEWQARGKGGTGMVGGLRVGHPLEGSPLSPMLQQWAAEDREKFKVKWGAYPH